MFLTKQGKLTKKCPACKQSFSKNKGSACLATCPEKKLEEKHQKILTKLVAYCLPKEKIVIDYLTNVRKSFEFYLILLFSPFLTYELSN